MSSFSVVVWRLSGKFLLIFILYLIIEYFNQFYLLISDLNPSEEHSVIFTNYPTSLLWYYSEILYSLLRITNIIKTTTSTEIYPIISAFSDLWNITDTIEEKSHNKFFSSYIDHSIVQQSQ